MTSEIEQTLIKKFVIKEKQERYLSFLANTKNRHKFINELSHFKDFNWKLFREIHGNESVIQVITEKIKNNKNPSDCYVISAETKYDQKVFSTKEAINNIVGTEETILIFGNAEVIYYEGEAPHNRYISI